MTDHPTEAHQSWDELAAGYALHSLEPDEARRFLDHSASCSRCLATLDDYALVAAQLGALADGELDVPPSWQHIRAGVISNATVSHLHKRRRQAVTRSLAATAAVVILAGVGVAGWHATRQHQPGVSLSTAALSRCEHQPGCRVIRLNGSKGDSKAAVIVDRGTVNVIPLAMPPAPTGRTYVLWQLPRDGSPIPVTEFRDTLHQVAARTLPAEYADTTAFAVSLESATTVPRRPTDVLAIGAAT